MKARRRGSISRYIQVYVLCVRSQLEEPFDMAIYKRRRSGARSRHRTKGIFGGKPCTMTLSLFLSFDFCEP